MTRKATGTALPQEESPSAAPISGAFNTKNKAVPREICIDGDKLAIDTLFESSNGLPTDIPTPISVFGGGISVTSLTSLPSLQQRGNSRPLEGGRWNALQCPPSPEHLELFGRFWQELGYGSTDQYEPLNSHAMASGAPVFPGDLPDEPTTPDEWEARMVSPPRPTSHYSPLPPVPPPTLSTATLPPVPRGATLKRGFSDTAVSSPVTPPRKQRRTDRTNKNKSSNVSCRIGADSTQMMSIHRMVAYLGESEDRRGLLQVMEDVVDRCLEKHENQSSSKYDNLPGAIFEDAVEELGGDVFTSIFKDSLAFHPQRRQAAAILANQDDTSYLERSDPRLPNLLEVGLAYGFHLARLSLMDHGGTFDDIQSMLEHGASTVLNMREEERVVLHRYVVGSPMLRP